MRRWLLGTVLLALVLGGCGGGPGGQQTRPTTAVDPPDSTTNTTGRPTNTTVPDAERLKECDRRAEQATVRFEPKRSMIVDQSEQVQVTASVDQVVPPTTTGDVAPSTTVVPVRLRCEVQAQLRGSGFDIDPEEFQLGSFLDRPEIDWSWDVVPRKGGDQKLTLDIQSVAVIDGRVIKGAGGRLFSTSISVDAAPESMWERMTRWSGQIVDHPLVRGFGSLAVVAGALAALWRWILKRPWPWRNRGSGSEDAGG